MPAKPKTEDPPETEQSEDSPDLEEKIRKVLGETLGSLFDSGKADVEDTAEKPEKKPKEEAKPITLRDVEEAAARMIREAQDKLHKSSAPSDDKAKGEGQAVPIAPAPPPEAETPPQVGTLAKLQKALWGS